MILSKECNNFRIWIKWITSRVFKGLCVLLVYAGQNIIVWGQTYGPTDRWMDRQSGDTKSNPHAYTFYPVQ